MYFFQYKSGTQYRYNNVCIPILCFRTSRGWIGTGYRYRGTCNDAMRAPVSLLLVWILIWIFDALMPETKRRHVIVSRKRYNDGTVTPQNSYTKILVLLIFSTYSYTGSLSHDCNEQWNQSTKALINHRSYNNWIKLFNYLNSDYFISKIESKCFRYLTD